VDKIGVSIEEPFSILPLASISATALANVRELAEMHDEVASVPLGAEVPSVPLGASSQASGSPVHPSPGEQHTNGRASSANGSSLSGHVSAIVSAAAMVSLSRPAAA
jgi:hypothetical protein